MSSNTKNLGLYKVDPKVDGKKTFNIDTMLNENWDKIDEAVSNVSVPVQSVNNKTGNITLTSEDIILKDGESVEEFKVKASTLISNLSSDIQNIDLSDNKINVIDTNNYFTSNKLNGVLDELFQFANNGKTSISSAVGSPLLASDTFSQQATKITSSKNILATNLSHKGVSANRTESLSSLVSKVSNISVQSMGGGIIKTGTVQSDSRYMVTVSGVGFKPRILMIMYYSRGMKYMSGSFYYRDTNKPEEEYHNSYSKSALKVGDNGTYVNSIGFKLSVPFDNETHFWIAVS